jgi:hypothetical protein
MIAKHLILEIIEITTKDTQESIELSFVKELIVTPIEELYQMRQNLVQNLESPSVYYPEFYEYY